MNSLDEIVLPFFRSMGLEDYLLDPEVSELMITNGLVFVENGRAAHRGRRPRGRRAETSGRCRNHCAVIGDQIDDY